MVSDTSAILLTIKNIFSNFSPIFLLIFGVFFGLWIFELLAGIFMDLASSKIELKKSELMEIRELVVMAKRRGIKLDRKDIQRKVKKEKEEKRFAYLSKKYDIG